MAQRPILSKREHIQLEIIDLEMARAEKKKEDEMLLKEVKKFYENLLLRYASESDLHDDRIVGGYVSIKEELMVRLIEDEKWLNGNP